MIKAYLASRPPSWTFLTIILAWESLLLSVIIKRVPYTEIDFKTYLQQVRQFTLDGVTNYGLIKGDSGPVAYPAGFLYAFELVRRLCDDGKNLVSAQVSFALLYLLQLILVFLVYRKCKAPLGTFILATLSKRLHSIFVLRMFNDCICMTVMYGCILAMTLRRWTLSSILFTLALSIKMNVLLFWPALIIIQAREWGLKSTFTCQLAMVILLAIISGPFLLTFPLEYSSMAYNFSRKFEWEWTVNWRFLGAENFEYFQNSRILLVLHFISLLTWINFRCLRSDGGILGLFRISIGREKNYKPLKPSEIVRWLFEANLLGMIFSRTLHYQFLSWYSLSIPFLLLVDTKRSLLTAAMVYFGIEYCWNVFPSTFFSSFLLFILNISLLLFTKS